MNLKNLNAHDLSFVIFNKFEHYFNSTPYSNKKIRLGIEVNLINLSKFILFALVSISLNILVESIICGICIGFLRITLGGKHASSSFKCTVFSLITLLDSVYLGKFVSVSNVVLILIYPIIIYLVYKYAPSDTLKNPIKSDERRKKLKMASIKKTILVAIISIIITNPVIKSLMFFSTISVIIFILPINLKSFKRSDINVNFTRKVS